MRAAAPLLLGAGAVDLYLLPARRSAANPRTPLLLPVDGTDGQRTDARPFHRPCSACYADSVNKLTIPRWVRMTLTGLRLVKLSDWIVVRHGEGPP